MSESPQDSLSSLSSAKLLTPGEVARILRVDPKTVSRWAANGQLRCVLTPGGHRRFFEVDIQNLISKGAS